MNDYITRAELQRMVDARYHPAITGGHETSTIGRICVAVPWWTTDGEFVPVCQLCKWQGEPSPIKDLAWDVCELHDTLRHGVRP